MLPTYCWYSYENVVWPSVSACDNNNCNTSTTHVSLNIQAHRCNEQNNLV